MLEGSGLDGLGLGLEEVGLAAGELDGPRVAAGGLDGLGWGVGLGADVPGWVAHAPGLEPVTSAAAPLAPARPALARLGLDEPGLGLAGDALVGLGLTVGDGLVELGLTVGDGLGKLVLGLGLAGDDDPARLELAAGLSAADVDEEQLAAGCPGFWVPCPAAAPVPAGTPPPAPPAPAAPAPWLPVPVPAGAPLMALSSAPACDSICCPNGVTTDTLIAMMNVTAATTAARRARPNRGRRGAAGRAAA